MSAASFDIASGTQLCGTSSGLSLGAVRDQRAPDLHHAAEMYMKVGVVHAHAQDGANPLEEHRVHCHRFLLAFARAVPAALIDLRAQRILHARTQRL